MRYNKRIKLLSKYTDKGQTPSNEEIAEAYAYLDNCYICGKELKFLDRITFNIVHTIVGNAHRIGCFQ